MAIGRKNRNPNGKLLIFKIKTKDEGGNTIAPVFQISEKINGKYEARKQTETEFSGNLTRIEIREQEFKGEKYNTVNLYFTDGDETYLLDTRVNMLTRSLYNSILALKTFEDVSVSLYVFKKETNGVVAEYPAISVRQGGEMVKWAVPISDQPKANPVMFKGKKINDYTDVDNFFVSKLRDFAKVVDAAAKTAPKPAPVSVPPDPVNEDGDVNEDVPF